MANEMALRTFKEIFEKPLDDNDDKITTIKIPRIQRDYAQGRDLPDEGRIRERFLEALYGAVTGSPITLDFVYGNISEEGELILLDGQQRLTTLFLLHLYAAKKEKVSECGFLKKFTYETRFSTTHFCEKICSDDFKFPVDPYSGNRISEYIKDQHWYSYDWKNDPSIQAMLVMLDAIDEKFHDVSNLWSALTTDRKIKFYFLSLKENNLTDEVYVKMNSRGRPLTEFEHFKAAFEKAMEGVSSDLHDEISHKIDGVWTDLFWFASGDNSLIDDKFVRYFRYISEIICFQKGITYTPDVFNLVETLYTKEQNQDAEQNIKFLREALDCWLKLNENSDQDKIGVQLLDFFDGLFSNVGYEPGKVAIYAEAKNYFLRCCTGKNFSNDDKLMLYAVILYLENRESILEADFQERLRHLRNLVFNSRMENLPSLLEAVDSLMLHDIIDVDKKGGSFNTTQMKEEKEKQEWIKANGTYRENLYKLEDHVLLHGAIRIVGLGNSALFDKFGLLFQEKNYSLINRVLLTFGDYSQRLDWRTQFGRNNTWRELFTRNSGIEKTSEVLCKLLSNLYEDNDEVNAFLEKRIANYFEDSKIEKTWRYYFVKYPAMSSGESGMYWWADNQAYNIVMMNTPSRLSGRHWNPFLYTLNKEFPSETTLGDFYTYSPPQLLTITNSGVKLDCKNDHWLVFYPDGQQETREIPQEDGVDTVDRIEMGKDIIKGLLENRPPITP